MAPSTPLSIGTASLLRLVKEEASYHRELEDQQKRIDKLEKEAASGKTPDDEIDNSEYMLNQERRALQETKKVLPSLKQKIHDAVAHIDRLLIEEGEKGMDSNVEQINAAKEAISKARTAEREIS